MRNPFFLCSLCLDVRGPPLLASTSIHCFPHIAGRTASSPWLRTLPQFLAGFFFFLFSLSIGIYVIILKYISALQPVVFNRKWWQKEEEEKKITENRNRNERKITHNVIHILIHAHYIGVLCCIVFGHIVNSKCSIHPFVGGVFGAGRFGRPPIRFAIHCDAEKSEKILYVRCLYGSFIGFFFFSFCDLFGLGFYLPIFRFENMKRLNGFKKKYVLNGRKGRR